MEGKKGENEKVAAELQAKKDDLLKANGEHKELQDKYRAIRRKIVEAEETLAQQTARSRVSASERSQQSNEVSEPSNAQEATMAKELEETYEALLAENKVLKTNLQACEANLQTFVNEMNSLLDQHELGSIVGQALMPNDIDLANVGAPLNSHPRGSGFNESPLGAD